MKKIIIENTKIIAIATILSVAVGVASAWTAPTQVAPNGNIAAPINASSSTQIKEGGLWVGSLGVDNGLVVENGNVGIGTTTPSEKLVVSGKLQITDGTQGLGKVLTSDINGKASWNSNSTRYSLSMNDGSGYGLTLCRIDTQTGGVTCKKTTDGAASWIVAASPYSDNPISYYGRYSLSMSDGSGYGLTLCRIDTQTGGVTCKKTTDGAASWSSAASPY